tara:strand:- start:8103 stop:8291 length:189 start_codon:yes stop_codon:yes gene_type:complete
MVTTEYGKQNIFGKETKPQLVEQSDLELKLIAEKLNGRFAMVGIIAALGAYAVTGQIIPGIF